VTREGGKVDGWSEEKKEEEEEEDKQRYREPEETLRFIFSSGTLSFFPLSLESRASFGRRVNNSLNRACHPLRVRRWILSLPMNPISVPEASLIGLFSSHLQVVPPPFVPLLGLSRRR